METPTDTPIDHLRLENISAKLECQLQRQELDKLKRELFAARATIDFYQNMEKELREVFGILKERYNLDFSADTDWGDLIGTVSGVLRKVFFSKKEQSDLQALAGRLSQTFKHFQNI